MRDGVKLAANVYRPAGNGPWPVVVSRTPYLKDGRPDRADSKLQLDANAKRYTDAGYVFVLQDT
ncbi:MAG: antibiotic hydrolase, partial [Phenylobacterium sp.]|nr:antibiotic hydrolase [Phenylobacterium sp.]